LTKSKEVCFDLPSRRTSNKGESMKVLGALLLLTSVGVASHQLGTYGRWEWEQIINPLHHEGLSFYSAICGIILVSLEKRK